MLQSYTMLLLLLDMLFIYYSYMNRFVVYIDKDQNYLC